jgi:hypothetical protein
MRGPEWFYIIQELGSVLYNIIGGVIASYLFERLRRPRRERVVITDASPTPTRFAEIVSDDFPVPRINCAAYAYSFTSRSHFD